MDDKQERHPFRKRLGELLRSVGKLRDGFLVTAAAFYFLGYIVWAMNAYQNGLGLLPALEFQYFIAGVLPMFSIFGLCFLFVLFRWLSNKVRNSIGDNPTGAKLYLCRVTLYLAIASVFLIITSFVPWFKATFPNAPRSWITIISMLVVIISYPCLRQLTTIKDISRGKTLRELSDASTLTFSIFLIWLAVAYAVLSLIVFAAIAFTYSVKLYSQLPQEFGGLRPYYACLDVVKAQISNKTGEGILPAGADKLNEPVVRSLGVEVLFSGSDMMLVRSEGKVYKIGRSAIQTVATCDEGETKVLRVARPTDNLPEVVKFYRDGLGLEVLSSFSGHNDFDGVMLGGRGSPYHLEFTHKRGHEAGKAPTEDNLLVFYIPNETEWKGAVERMQKHGYAPVKSYNPWWDDGGKTFEDIDGYRVVLYNKGWNK